MLSDLSHKHPRWVYLILALEFLQHWRNLIRPWVIMTCKHREVNTPAVDFQPKKKVTDQCSGLQSFWKTFWILLRRLTVEAGTCCSQWWLYVIFFFLTFSVSLYPHSVSWFYLLNKHLVASLFLRPCFQENPN